MSISTITIDTVDYTSYASVAEADAYLRVDAARYSTWNALATDAKGAYLIQATRRLDMLFWTGTKTGGGSQENAWPRSSLTYQDDGSAVSTSEVPQQVENATALLAGSIALDETAGDQGSSSGNTKTVKAGSASVTFFRFTEGGPLQDTSALALVKQWLESGGSFTGAYSTGTDGESTFSDIDQWGVNRGYP